MSPSPSDLFMAEWQKAVTDALTAIGGSRTDATIDLSEVRAGREIYGDEYIERWDHDRDDGVWIELIERESTLRGVGTAVMTALGDVADRTGTHLMLCPIACEKRDRSHMPQEKLEAWYVRLGYEPMMPYPGCAMIRRPSNASR